jgi:outer membrane lipoprotein-sorting protein
MKRLLILMLLLAAIAAESLAADQSASKIIDRYKKVSGGAAASRVKSTFVMGTVAAADGSTGRFTYQLSSPGSMRIDIEAGAYKESECYNGKSAWRLDAGALRTLLGDEAKRLRLEALLANSRLGELARNRIIPQLAGKSTVEGRDANAIEFLRDGVRVKLLFDASTGLIVKRERETAGGIQETFYDDYRAADGVMEPFSIRIKKTGNPELHITVDRVEHNHGVDAIAFRYPQTEGAPPLPDLDSLMKSIVANQDKIDEMRERYTCRLTQVERKHDGDGRVK